MRRNKLIAKRTIIRVTVLGQTIEPDVVRAAAVGRCENHDGAGGARIQTEHTLWQFDNRFKLVIHDKNARDVPVRRERLIRC